jgi:M6 family metalloprotease-like protein
MPVPYDGEPIVLRNPDGSEFAARLWGDQFAAVIETADGYTVVEDPETGHYHYAVVAPDKRSLLPAGDRVADTDPATLDLPRHARPQRGALAAQARESRAASGIGPRWAIRHAEKRARAAAGGPAGAPPQETTTGTYVGLCLLVDFPDVPAAITREQVDAFCNEIGHTGFGNNGSVRDYFTEVSGGLLTYTNVVAAYYTAQHPRAYYTDESIPQPQRTWELIGEALDHLTATGFDFSTLTTDGAGFVRALNVFYAGDRVNNWAKGLWPHSWHLAAPRPVTATASLNDYQITNMGAALTLRTFCHENGHMICDYPDLYDYGSESFGIGHYCLMCYGGSDVNPVHVNAYLKNASGWASAVTTATPGDSVTLAAGSNEFLLHRKPRSATEYYIVENRQQSGRDRSLPDAGLAIWHVDERGSNSDEQGTAAQHYECALVQADGRQDLEHRANAGDVNDLYGGPAAPAFDRTTTPRSRWWSGRGTALQLKAISAPGPKITVTIGR